MESVWAWMPEGLLRQALRRSLHRRLKDWGDRAAAKRRSAELAHTLTSGPLALHPAQTHAPQENLPPQFFEALYGPYCKASCNFWSEPAQSLEAAERLMLELVCERAKLGPGQNVLDAGCGWGALTLYIAERYPSCRVTALAPTHAHAQYVQSRLKREGRSQARVIPGDLNTFDSRERFDRVIALEGLESVCNFGLLLRRFKDWLDPGGLLFLQMISHCDLAYRVGPRFSPEMMAGRFPRDGIMPSYGLLLQFNTGLDFEQRWWIGGEHYRRTCETWLANLKRRRKELLRLLGTEMGFLETRRQTDRWRIFFLSGAELFGYREGTEWGVSQYRFRKGGG